MAVDIAILGAGPAGWAMAAAFADTGRSTVLIAPMPTAVWTNTYGGWLDQLDDTVASLFGHPVHRVIDHRWPTVRVIGDRDATAGRTYVRFDNTALLDVLTKRAASCDVVAATVISLEHGAEATTVGLSQGSAITATLVVDATGAASPFVTRTGVPARPAMQAAYGIITTVALNTFQPANATLMDWRGPDRRDATFLYALSLGHDRWLLEETSLARRPALPMGELKQRLFARLDGIEIGAIEHEELVEFPVESGLPDLRQRVVGFGAAAALTHPATGYSVVRSLRAAPGAAAAIDAAFDRGPIVAARAGWRAMWSDDRLRARRLEQYGLLRLLDLDQRDTRAFFDAFFQLPTPIASAYLSGEASSADVSKAMWALFRRAPRHLQAKLATGNPLLLAKSLLR